jgi:hypothetical protein
MTTNSDPDNGTSRDDLVQRIQLMEAMIAEGRSTTTRCGWIFVLWGLVDLAPIGWQLAEPNSRWVSQWCWPICLSVGVLLTLVGRALQDRGKHCTSGTRSRSIWAVWGIMGSAITLYFIAAMVKHLAWQYSFEAGILMMIGMAHGISSIILRWRVQGAVAAIWAMGSFATFFSRSWKDETGIFAFELVFGMIVFGLYAMWLDGRDRAGRSNNHA